MVWAIKISQVHRLPFALPMLHRYRKCLIRESDPSFRRKYLTNQAQSAPNSAIQTNNAHQLLHSVHKYLKRSLKLHNIHLLKTYRHHNVFKRNHHSPFLRSKIQSLTLRRIQSIRQKLRQNRLFIKVPHRWIFNQIVAKKDEKYRKIIFMELTTSMMLARPMDLNGNNNKMLRSNSCLPICSNKCHRAQKLHPSHKKHASRHHQTKNQ